MQAAALDILHFLDGLEKQRARRDMILSSAVASGVITAVEAWPEFFTDPGQGDPGAFPSTDADMSGFQIEQATPGSFARDMELMEALAANQVVSVREEEPPAFPGFTGLPHPEWTL